MPIILVLFPIMIFNKTSRHRHKDFGAYRLFTWGLFLATIGVGAIGTYESANQLHALGLNPVRLV